MQKQCFGLLGLFLSFGLACNLFAFTTSGKTFRTDGSQADFVNAAIAKASAGDTIEIPAGSFTWGTGGKAVRVNKAVVVQGTGRDRTTIYIANSAPCWNSGTIEITAGTTVRNFATVQPNGRPTTVFSAGGANGSRISNIKHASAPNCGYFVYAGSYGLIDSCNIVGGGGSDELIFSRGPSNSWQTANSCGTADAVYIEDCVFDGHGYVCDLNSNARGVVRFCTINGTLKVDAHGLASNTPPRGVRQTEVYCNHWTSTGFWAAIEIRGGTGYLFDNVQEKKEGLAWFLLKEYGCENRWPNFGQMYQTPRNYPISDQIGVGKDPKLAASEPMYLWNNRVAGGDWVLASNLADLNGAIALYRTQTGNSAASFGWEDIRQGNRDYFKGTVSAKFNGSSGIGCGTKSKMLAIEATNVGVGFWVTDEGSWNTKLPANTSGRLYVWNGSTWVLKYTPYTYPHPLRSQVARE